MELIDVGVNLTNRSLLRDLDGNVTRLWCSAVSGEGMGLLFEALAAHIDDRGLATADADADALHDPLAGDDMSAFWPVLSERTWVLHSARQDIEVIYQAAGRKHLSEICATLRHRTEHYLHAYMIKLGGMPPALVTATNKENAMEARPPIAAAARPKPDRQPPPILPWQMQELSYDVVFAS